MESVWKKNKTLGKLRSFGVFHIKSNQRPLRRSSDACEWRTGGLLNLTMDGARRIFEKAQIIFHLMPASLWDLLKQMYMCHFMCSHLGFAFQNTPSPQLYDYYCMAFDSKTNHSSPWLLPFWAVGIMCFLCFN